MKVSNNSGLNNLNQLDVSKNSKLDKKQDVFTKSKDKGVTEADLKSASSVDLSNKAQQMQKAKDLASNIEVDNEKVDRLQKLIDNGKYEVDSKAVADRLVDEHLLMS